MKVQPAKIKLVTRLKKGAEEFEMNIILSIFAVLFLYSTSFANSIASGESPFFLDEYVVDASVPQKQIMSSVAAFSNSTTSFQSAALFNTSSGASYEVSASAPSINGSTSVSPGTVKVNGAGTPSYTEKWNDLIKLLDTPEKVSTYMVSNFSYKAHGSDTPYSPEELNKLRVGDCKDFAAFSGTILSANGYKGNLISFGYAKNLGHAATLYNKDGADWIMSNGGIFGPVRSQSELISVAKVIIDAPQSYKIGPIQYYPLGYQGAFGIGDWSP